MRSKKWTVKFVRFDEFFAVITQGHENSLFTMFLNADVVVGGIDFSGDFW